MRESIVLLTVLFVCTGVNVALPHGNYTILRHEILEHEQRMMIGARLTLDDIETTANRVLMKAKQEELDVGFQHPLRFPPARNFLEARGDIEKSKVFDLLRRMPKGAVLHAHDTSLVSGDYLYNNITFRDDLYVCMRNGLVHLRFFRNPDQTCRWELLKDVRKDPDRAQTINSLIKQRLTMECDDPSVRYSNGDKAWIKFRDIFQFADSMLTYRPVYEDHFLQALRELYEDNVMYLELRSTLPTLYDFEGTMYKSEDLVGIYENLTERFKKEHPDFIGMKLIYSPKRSGNHKLAENYMDTMRELKRKYPNFVAGFDLVGQEDKGHPLEYFADIMRNAEKDDIKFFFHAGETNWLGSSTDENLVDAILLNTQRIGHGYALSSHPFLLELTKRMDIAIEVNPISNQVLKLVDDLRNHPARSLFSEGYPLVISNDDPGFWGAKALTYDFYEAFMALASMHADLRTLKQLALNSLTYSSLSSDEKEKALNIWHGKWRAFIENVVREACLRHAMMEHSNTTHEYSWTVKQKN